MNSGTVLFLKIQWRYLAFGSWFRDQDFVWGFNVGPWNWLIQIEERRGGKAFCIWAPDSADPRLQLSEAPIPSGIKVFLSLLWEICKADFVNHL